MAMLNHAVLYVGDPRTPPLQKWIDAFAGSSQVRITTEQTPDADAALVSAYRCEAYGCRAGSTEDTLGIMNVYDTWNFELPNQRYPRILISNAVWRKDPPLLEAIDRRFGILAGTLDRFDRTGVLRIRSLAIDCAVLGFWQDYPCSVQIQGIALCRTRIAQLLGG